MTPELQISNFSFVKVEHKKGFPVVKLRFTVVFTFGDPQMAIGLDGCLAHRTTEDELVWGPPLSMVGYGRHLKTCWVNEEVYDRVLAGLASTEYIAKIGRQVNVETVGKIMGAEAISV